MCYPVCVMLQIKDPLLLSEWSITIWPIPYNHKQNVLSALLNKLSFPFSCLWFDIPLMMGNYTFQS